MPKMVRKVMVGILERYVVKADEHSSSFCFYPRRLGIVEISTERIHDSKIPRTDSQKQFVVISHQNVLKK